MEHIHAQNAEKFTEKQEFIDWLKDIQPLLEDIKDNERYEGVETTIGGNKNKRSFMK